MKKIQILLLATMFVITAATSTAQVTGTVFRDFNFNGTQQTSGFPVEPGCYGVQVRAYNAANVQIGPTKTTNVAGTFSFTALEIPATTNIRIEFTPLTGTFDSKAGTSANGSSVQFLVAGASATANYAVSSQDWYSSTANPYVATNAATNGDPLAGGTAGTNYNLHIFPYDMGNGTPDDGGTTRRLANSQTGTVFGMAFQKTSRTLIMSAYLKRHAGLGSAGINGIYRSEVSATGVPTAATLLVNVSSIGINVGINPRSTTLPAASNGRNTDAGTFANIGKIGIGGIDISEDGKDLFIVNMFEKKLQRINIGNPIKASFTAADVTGSWVITDPSTAGTVWHPMACKTANGRVYVGGVVVREKATAHNLAADTVGSRGIVYEFDPSTGVFTEVLRFPLSYRRGFANNDYRYSYKNNWWCAWQNNGNGASTDPMEADYNAAGAGVFTGGVYYPQAMLANIDFDVDGSMIVGIRDRFGDQTGYQNVTEDNLPVAGGFPASPGNYYRGLTSGEILRAGKNLGLNSYAMETVGTSTSNGVTTISAGAASGNPTVGGSWTGASPSPWGGVYGPGWNGIAGAIPGGGPNPGITAGYFYFNQNFSTTGTPGTLNNSGSGAINAHYNKTDGTVTILAGANEIMYTAMDPMATSFTQGLIKNFNSGVDAGDMSQRLQLTVSATGDPTNMGKANGLGDVEVLTDYQPIEVGNRVWLDANSDGVQNAGEATFTGVTVLLMSPGVDGIFGNGDDVQLASTTTNATGQYFFSALTTADTRRPANWTGVSTNTILPGFNYRIRILISQAALTGYMPTLSNTTTDNTDNDGTVAAGYSVIDFNTATSDHTFDFGFRLGTLPVHSIDVTATLQNNDVKVKWVTGNEINVHHYEVERSVDNRNFTATGNNVPAAPNQYGAGTYNLQDDISALLQNNYIYYRIRIVDIDGKISYSNVVAVKLNKKAGVQVWPNPVKDKINIAIKSTANSTVEISLNDAAGKQLRSDRSVVVKGNNQIVLGDLGELPAGIYILRVTDINTKERTVIKLIKD